MKAKNALQVLLISIIVFSTFADASNSTRMQTAERRLIDYLMAGYDPRVRPVALSSSIINIDFSLSLQQILDFDEKSQVITTNMYMDWLWKDEFLKWNPKDYEGIESIRLPAKNVWKPDILVYNSAVSSFDQMLRTNVIVYNSGSVSWLPPGIFQTTCDVQIRNFPFDQQSCKLKFGAWTHHGGLINLTLAKPEAVTDDYTENGEYEYISMKGQYTSQKYNCCENPFIDITYTLVIKRRVLFYGFNLILPCLLICFLTLLVFMLPADAGERITLTITILLALVVFLQLVNDSLPPADEIPLLVKFFACSIIMVTMSVIATVISLNFHHTNSGNTSEMPNYIRWIFLYFLPKILKMKRPGEFSFRRKFLDEPDDLANGKDIEEVPLKTVDIARQQWSETTPNTLPKETCLGDINNEMNQILEEIKFITNRMHSEDKDELSALEWQFAAAVLDKFCLYIFTIYLVLATVFTLGFGSMA